MNHATLVSFGRFLVSLGRRGRSSLSRRFILLRQKPTGQGMQTVFLTASLATFIVISFQLRESSRQGHLAYLQNRSQDFLQFEYTSASMGCIYDWWIPPQPPILDTRIKERPAVDCFELYNNYNEYARHALYIEEVLLFFVEESRVACENQVSFGHDLDIWRNDMHEDRSGLFSYYILHRFGDPTIPFVEGALLPVSTPKDRVRLFLLQARLLRLNLYNLCGKATEFQKNLTYKNPFPPHIKEICTQADGSIIGEDYQDKDPFDWEYCHAVHGTRPSLGRGIMSWLTYVDESVAELWGIARAMLFLLAIPLALSTVPALILTWLGRLRLAALFIALFIPLIWLSWWMA